MNTILAVLGLSGGELIIVFVAILVLFGAKKIPEFAKGLGQGIKEFKKASSDVTNEFHNAMNQETPPPPACQTARRSRNSRRQSARHRAQGLIAFRPPWIMAEPSEELQPDERGREGGAVKSFLEHLEDLRWMLIKSAAATLVGMMVCLFAVHNLSASSTWPLKRAEHRHLVFMPENTNTVLHLRLGSKSLEPLSLAATKLAP